MSASSVHLRGELAPADVSAYYADRVPGLRQQRREWRGPCPVPSANISNLQLNPDGSFRSGVVSGTRTFGREDLDHRVFRVGLRVSF